MPKAKRTRNPTLKNTIIKELRSKRKEAAIKLRQLTRDLWSFTKKKGKKFLKEVGSELKDKAKQALINKILNV